MNGSVRRLVTIACMAATAMGCAGGTSAAPEAASVPPQATTWAEFGAAYCAAFDALVTAVGNPDAGSDSDLTASLKAAVEAHDAATADRLAAEITGHLERGRRAAWIARGWRSAGPAMAQLERVLIAFEAMVEARRAAAAGASGAPDPQAAFEQAGGVTAWFAMLEAMRGLERPPGTTPTTCPTVPVSY